jgi:hypothetical protein
MSFVRAWIAVMLIASIVVVLINRDDPLPQRLKSVAAVCILITIAATLSGLCRYTAPPLGDPPAHDPVDFPASS